MDSAIGIFCFAVLIFVHELGHFLVAKAFQMPVKEFALGFGPKLLSWTPAGSGASSVSLDMKTTYSLRLIPLGGFVALDGEHPQDAETGKESERFKVSSKKESEEVLCDSNSTPKLVHLATEITSISETHIDVVEHFNSTTPDSFYQRPALQRFCVYLAGPLANLIFAYVLFYACAVFMCDPFTATFSGLIADTNVYVSRVFDLLGSALSAVSSGETDNIGGPIAIVHAFSVAYQTTIADLMFITGIISLQLGLFNLLPLPILDGGQIGKIIYDDVLKLKFPARLRTALTYTSLVSLFGLMTFAIYQDILRYLPK